MSIKKYTNSKGTFYEAWAYSGKDPLTGKEIKSHKKGFKTRKEAQQWKERVRVNGIEPSVERLKVNDLYSSMGRNI